MAKNRSSQINRKTNETDIKLKLNIDGNGKLKSKLPIPFFEHMLDHLAKYSMFDIELKLSGDIKIDCHHSVEDTAIVLGDALKEALGNKVGIFRYGAARVPMDETLVEVIIDFSGRPYFNYTGLDLTSMGKFGIYDSELTLEFLHKLSIHAAMNIHVIVNYGHNRHHIHEAIFKALGMSLRRGAEIDPARKKEIPSTKGSL